MLSKYNYYTHSCIIPFIVILTTSLLKVIHRKSFSIFHVSENCNPFTSPKQNKARFHLPRRKHRCNYQQGHFIRATGQYAFVALLFTRTRSQEKKLRQKTVAALVGWSVGLDTNPLTKFFLETLIPALPPRSVVFFGALFLLFLLFWELSRLPRSPPLVHDL